MKNQLYVVYSEDRGLLPTDYETEQMAMRAARLEALKFCTSTAVLKVVDALIPPPAADAVVVKSFKDARRILGKNHAYVVAYTNAMNGIFGNVSASFNRSYIAYMKLRIISEVLNEGWQPDWTNQGEERFYPCFEYGKSGEFKFRCLCIAATAEVGGMICYKTRDLAEYAGRQFIDIYKELFI